ncbi:MAG: MBL fold metallo-hydrolase [Traorella sp.]
MEELKVEFSYVDVGDNIIAITAPMREQIYLVKGKQKCLVIDNGMGIGSLKNYIEKNNLNDGLELVMVNTHGHPDHAGGNIEFDTCYINKLDIDVYNEMVTKEFRANDIKNIFKEKGDVFIENLLDFSLNLTFIEEGFIFELGDRNVQVINVPGHTKGSIVLYDINYQNLIVGDALTIRDTWLYLSYSTPLNEYYKALLKLKEMNLNVKRVLCGHLPNIDDYSLLDRKIACVEQVLLKKNMGEEVNTFAGKGNRMSYANTDIIFNKDNLY